MNNSTKPVVIIGPSGAGKGTLTSLLFSKHPKIFGKKISTTTRAPREGEVNGVHYFFLTEEEFAKSETNGEFIETSLINGKRYGTSYKAVLEASSGNRIPVLELDTNVVLEAVPKLGAVLVWVGVPTKEILYQRLVGRGAETAEQIETRLETARKEITFFKEHKSIFNKVLVNDDLATAYNELEMFLKETFDF